MKNKILSIICFMLILVSCVSGCSEDAQSTNDTTSAITSEFSSETRQNSTTDVDTSQVTSTAIQSESLEETTTSDSASNVSNNVSDTMTPLEIHYIDVGQGDATLIKCGDDAMLIDAGDNDKGTQIRAYLMSQNVSKLKYVIGTHPDADHYGGLDVVIYNFDCENIFLSDLMKDNRTCDDVVQTMKNKYYTYTTPAVGSTYTLGDATIQFVGPVKNDYSEANNHSLVLLVKHGDNTFLFTGDAEEESERDILAANTTISCDVMQAGHHGSSSSNTEKFLKTASPEYMVISCGENNQYGHPHSETMNTLRAMGVKVFRTDLQGTIVVKSDGKNLTFNCSPDESYVAGEPQGSSQNTTTKETVSETTITETTTSTENTQNTQLYVVNTNTKKFHLPDCSSAKRIKDENRMEVNSTKEELIEEGYSPCKNCLE